MVTLINTFTVTGDVAEFRRVVADIGAYMREQPGFLGHEMFRSLSKPHVFVETARWEDAASHRRAVQSEEFRARARVLTGIATPDADLYASDEDPHGSGRDDR